MKRRPPGRPRTRRPDLLTFNTSLTPEAKARLQALAEVEHEHGYILLEAAFWNCWKNLPADKRSKAEALAKNIERAMKEEAERK